MVTVGMVVGTIPTTIPTVTMTNPGALPVHHVL